MAEPETRPPLHPGMTGPQLRRWYWLRSELAAFARELGVPAAGSKADLTDRIADHLDGDTTTRSAGGKRASRQPGRSAPQTPTLRPPLTLDTVIPPGQPCSQALRAFFVEQVGRGFRFDGHMRDFVAEGAGRTLGEAVEHWRRTRDTAPREIAPQFEFNLFTRRWHSDHPAGSRDELLRAWAAYRGTPADQRD